MNEFYEDSVNYVHTDKDSERFTNIGGIIRYVEMIRKRISAGKFQDKPFEGEYALFYTQTVDEVFDDFIKALTNTNNLYRLEEIQEGDK